MASSSVTKISPDWVLGYTSTLERAIELIAVFSRATTGSTLHMPPKCRTTDDEAMFSGEQLLMALEDDQESLDSWNMEVSESDGVNTMEPEGLGQGADEGAADSNSGDDSCGIVGTMTQWDCDGGGTALDSVVDSMVELTEVLIALKDMFSSWNRSKQEVLANKVSSLPGAYEGFYSLFFDIFERK
jgi:hypothetical protein